jgi:hypothetical protein
MMEARACMLFAFLAVVECAACATGPAPVKQAPRPGQWVLVQTPPKGELGENTFPPIVTWRRVRVFDDAESCSNFRVDMMWDAQSVASRAMLEEVSNLHCVPAAKLAAPVTSVPPAR